MSLCLDMLDKLIDLCSFIRDFLFSEGEFMLELLDFQVELSVFRQQDLFIRSLLLLEQSLASRYPVPLRLQQLHLASLHLSTHLTDSKNCSPSSFSFVSIFFHLAPQMGIFIVDGFDLLFKAGDNFHQFFDFTFQLIPSLQIISELSLLVDLQFVQSSAESEVIFFQVFYLRQIEGVQSLGLLQLLLQIHSSQVKPANLFNFSWLLRVVCSFAHFLGLRLFEVGRFSLEHEHEKVCCSYIIMARVRQFGELRESRFSSTSKHSVNHTNLIESRNRSAQPNYLCVQCVNSTLIKLKQSKDRQNHSLPFQLVNDLNVSRKIFEEQDRRSRVKKIEEKRQIVTEYNQQVARQKSELKVQEEKRMQMELKLQEEMRKRQEKSKQEALKRERLLKQQWMNGIRRQIQQHQHKKIKEKQEKLAEQPEKSIIQNPVTYQSQDRILNFRRELKQQMLNDEARKKAEKEESRKQIDIRAIPLLDRAEKRERLIHELEEHRKQILLEDARSREEKLRSAQQEREAKNIRERVELELDQKREDNLRRANRERREKTREEYINSLKEQIEAREKSMRERKSQAQHQHSEEVFCISDKKRQSTSHCNSCLREVPKATLTNFKDPSLEI